jgi:hypothetical protein
MVINPFGDKTARLIHQRLGMMDTVEGGAGAKRCQVFDPVGAQVSLGGDDSTFAASANMTEVTSQGEHHLHG